MITLIQLNDEVVNICVCVGKVGSHLVLLCYAYGSGITISQQN